MSSSPSRWIFCRPCFFTSKGSYTEFFEACFHLEKNIGASKLRYKNENELTDEAKVWAV